MKDVLNKYFSAILNEREFKLWEYIISRINESSFEKNTESAIQTEIEGTDDVFSPWIIKFSQKELNDYGRLDDLESPLGFFAKLTPFKHPDNELRIYAPCFISILERYKYWSPEILAMWMHNIHKVPLRDAYEICRKDVDKKQKMFDTTKKTLKKYWYEINEIIAYIKAKKLRAGFYSLSSSMHFYEEGRRFYRHPDADVYYVGSKTPGVIFPEEYYGEEIYCPSITQDIPPGSFWDPESQGFKNWMQILSEKIRDNQAIENPFRSIYFDEGIVQAKKRIIYSIFKEEFISELKKRFENWSKKGKLNEYQEDTIKLIRYFLEQPQIDIYLLPINSQDSILNLNTLVSKDGFHYISERDDEEKKKIRKGKVWNVKAIEKFFKELNKLFNSGKEVVEFFSSVVTLFGLAENIDKVKEIIENHTIKLKDKIFELRQFCDKSFSNEELIKTFLREGGINKLSEFKINLIENEISKGEEIRSLIGGNFNDDRIARWLENLLNS